MIDGLPRGKKFSVEEISAIIKAKGIKVPSDGYGIVGNTGIGSVFLSGATL